MIIKSLLCYHILLEIIFLSLHYTTPTKKGVHLHYFFWFTHMLNDLFKINIFIFTRIVFHFFSLSLSSSKYLCLNFLSLIPTWNVRKIWRACSLDISLALNLPQKNKFIWSWQQRERQSIFVCDTNFMYDAYCKKFTTEKNTSIAWWNVHIL